jgi:hypothetical protein
MAKKPDIELPTEFGKKWTEMEEQQLLNELEIDMDCNTVAENHKRTLGGIRSRIYEMAYRMHQNNTLKEEIMKTMRLTEGHLDDIIARQTVKEDNKMKRKERKEPEEKPLIQMNRPVLELVPPLQAEFNIVKTEIQQIKQDLTEIKTELKTFSKEMSMLKKSVGQMMVMIKQIYEFETEQ